MGRCVSAVEFGVRRILMEGHVLDSHDAKRTMYGACEH